jgi:hypothetical protein
MKGWLVQSVLTSLQNMTCSVFLNSEREMNCPATSASSGSATGATSVMKRPEQRRDSLHRDEPIA